MDLHPDRACISHRDPMQAKEELNKVMAAYDMLRKHHRQVSFERYRAMRRDSPIQYRPGPGFARPPGSRWETWHERRGGAFRGTEEHETEEEFHERMQNLAQRYAIDAKTRNRVLAAWFGSICAYFAWDFREYHMEAHRPPRATWPSLQIHGVR